MKVKTQYSECSYITAHKEYEVSRGQITDDEGGVISIPISGYDPLRSIYWDIVYKQLEKVELNGRYKNKKGAGRVVDTDRNHPSKPVIFLYDDGDIDFFYPDGTNSDAGYNGEFDLIEIPEEAVSYSLFTDNEGYINYEVNAYNSHEAVINDIEDVFNKDVSGYVKTTICGKDITTRFVWREDI